VTASPTSDFAIRAPTRIDFGGGWTDVPPYDVEQGGFVCNVAIARYATVRVGSAPPARGVELSVVRPSDAALLEAAAAKYKIRESRLTLTSDFPVAAGLGGSSAAGVATIAAIFKSLGQSHRREEIAEASREIEIRELGIAGGRQDHYAAALGGALGITFGDAVTAERIPLSATIAAELPTRCLVMYTGESRISGDTITAVLNAYRAGERRVHDALRRMRELAEEMARVLGGGDFDRLGSLVGEHWEHQRSLDPAIPTPLIDAMIDRAMKAGATGCKALGASGGGCVLIIAPLDRMPSVRSAVGPLGTAIDYTLDMHGVSECP
jgi:D-glycero-alpha-D-manno-heptose-7-phosphate kinase